MKRFIGSLFLLSLLMLISGCISSQQPQQNAVYLALGQSQEFSVTAVGTIQWYFVEGGSDLPIPNATKNTYLFESTQYDTGEYTLKVVASYEDISDSRQWTIVVMPSTPSADPALSGFEKITDEEGFGNSMNIYAWSMEIFGSDIYVGTLNLLKPSFNLDREWDFDSQVGLLPDITTGTEVFRYDGSQWQQVVDGGLGDRFNIGLRKMIIWHDDSNRPVIYGTTCNPIAGLEVWRTYDGENWEVVVGVSAPDPDQGIYGNGFTAGRKNFSGRGMTIFKDPSDQEWLYLGTLKANGGEIWRTANGVNWEKVADADSIEGPDSAVSQPIAISDMMVYDDGGGDALFVGTWGLGGLSVYKSYNGEDFVKVASGGIIDPDNLGVHKLITFQGRLWLLGENYDTGFPAFVSKLGKTIDSNDDWELVATGGFTNPDNRYAWQGQVYDNGSGERLYIGTTNPEVGAHLYSVTQDGQWAVEMGTEDTPPGWGNPDTRGIRTMSIWEGKLVLGTTGVDKGIDVYLAE